MTSGGPDAEAERFEPWLRRLRLPKVEPQQIIGERWSRGHEVAPREKAGEVWRTSTIEGRAVSSPASARGSMSAAEESAR